jgi:hypothetical protein
VVSVFFVSFLILSLISVIFCAVFEIYCAISKFTVPFLRFLSCQTFFMNIKRQTTMILTLYLTTYMLPSLRITNSFYWLLPCYIPVAFLIFDYFQVILVAFLVRTFLECFSFEGISNLPTQNCQISNFRFCFLFVNAELPFRQCQSF